jgi:LysR family transcriptional regulator (chromosome initiation inhibitor)
MVSALWEFRSLVAAIFVHEGIQLDVVIDGQNHKYTLLESSQVIGCISTRSLLMRGCFAKPLDSFSYHLVASPPFGAMVCQGLTRDTARKVPVFAYSRKDTLQSHFMQSCFGLHADAYPKHHMSLPEARLEAIPRCVVDAVTLPNISVRRGVKNS